jgi:hypothetical protein
MSSLKEYIEKDAELRERFVEEAFDEGDISDYPSFENALLNAFDTQRGKNASKKGLDDEDLKALFESNECQARMRQVLNEEQFNETYALSKNQVAIRKTAMGKEVKPNQVMVITVPKTQKMGGYTRTFMGKKISVIGYKRSFKSWKDKEVRFLQIKKQQGVLTPKQVIYAYNSFFVGEERTESSITTKLYRL